MYLYAADGYSSSSGDTFTYLNLRFTVSYPLKDEIYNMS